MQAFETFGQWWVPEFPEKKCSGMLSCNESGELRLSIMGGLLGFNEHLNAEASVLIHGEIADDRFGRRVTLRGCLPASWTHSGDPADSKQEFVAQCGFFGRYFVAQGDFTFSTVDLKVSGLNEWADTLSGFSATPDSFSISYDHPNPIAGEFPYGSFTIGVSSTSSGTRREKRITENVGIRLRLNDPLSDAAISDSVVYTLQNFFSFAADCACAVSQFKVGRESLALDSITVIGPATFADESVADGQRPWKMLFGLADIAERVEKVIQLWFELSQRHSFAFAEFFGNIYRPPGYMDYRFMGMVRVISLLHMSQSRISGYQTRSDDVIQHALGKLDSESTKVLGKLIDSHPIVTLERALRSLTSQFQSLFEPLTKPLGSNGSQQLIEQTIQTLHYVLTRSSPNRVVDGSDLYWMTERLALLFKMSLLSELGFTAEELKTLIERNPIYKHIRDHVLLSRD